MCLWIISKGKDADQHRDREGDTLFIDAREMYEEVNRNLNRLNEDHIHEIAKTVRAYRGESTESEYQDEKGFCAVVDIKTIEENDWVITPGRYVGIPEKENEGEPFQQKMERLTGELTQQFEKSNQLEDEIRENLRRIGYEV